MRELILKNFWNAKNFRALGDAECVANFGDVEKEREALRNSAMVCDFSFAKKFSFDESEGLDFLDSVLAANILKLRYGRIIDTFLASDDGEIKAEIFAANIDDKIFVVAESLDDSATDVFAGNANCADLTDTHVLLSVDGPDAWRVAKAIFGSDIFNLPYLSIEKYTFDGTVVYLMRNGKTGEFGYQFMAPAAVAEKLAAEILAQVNALNGSACGFDTHEIARLEGNFFNVYAEGASVKNPLELGLQWMIDVNKESFAGSEKILARRAAGGERKIIFFESNEKLDVGDKIFDGDVCVGSVATSKSFGGKNAGLALMDEKFALAGFAFSSKPNGDCDLRSASRPSILALSLQKGMEQE